ncbi:MAG: four helix bundle protein [Candidatus Magasanikbacteria bacterium CG_4_10_14_0_2_um_filter_33_14]|uniref:Four helix bundle protein n=1 Tax=Candidatus Magasanikbacteria bacterium CG_4_10_14_0_2_um_filter_33_14 TaxID=1974636 RepID=A0A2M7VBE4_9BACT|nr:MAG: four helix bundle protein [Candidatus Magasanikbacteria bacterium CG_4_10_14_0_2_um_filter_33_14]
MEYDLENRTLDFSKSILKYTMVIEKTIVTIPLVSQLIRSATSVGANYREANNASSKKDFINKISISKKEINETKYWIELLADVLDESNKRDLRKYWKEANELTLIFNKIYHSSKNKN